MIVAWIIAIIFILYSALVLYCWAAWITIPQWMPRQQNPVPAPSIIVPARNEEINITPLLDSLLAQTLRSEIIIVDDHSTDQTAERARSYPAVTVLSLTEDGMNSYKKFAIAKGIGAATSSYILATDADCMAGKNWSYQMASFAHETGAAFVAAPVSMENGRTVLSSFQSLDFMILQGITGAIVTRNKIPMCNGANILYKKEAFNKVGGFDGIDSIASGDDMLLMYKIMKAYPGKPAYLKSKEVIIHTKPMGSWTDFINQRIRWASKSAHYQDKRLFPILLLVYLFNLSFLFLGIAGFIHSMYWQIMLALFAGKIIVEWPLVIATARFFNKPWLAILFPSYQPLHIIYTIMAGLLGRFSKYKWKGRIVK